MFVVEKAKRKKKTARPRLSIDSENAVRSEIRERYEKKKRKRKRERER